MTGRRHRLTGLLPSAKWPVGQAFKVLSLKIVYFLLCSKGEQFQLKTLTPTPHPPPPRGSVTIPILRILKYHRIALFAALTFPASADKTAFQNIGKQLLYSEYVYCALFHIYSILVLALCAGADNPDLVRMWWTSADNHDVVRMCRSCWGSAGPALDSPSFWRSSFSSSSSTGNVFGCPHVKGQVHDFRIS